MRAQKHWAKWIAVLTLGAVAGACESPAPTEVEALPSPAAASFATSSATSIAKVLVLPYTATLKVGELKQLVSIPQTAAGKTTSLAGNTVVWSSSDPAVASVTSTGLVVAHSGGTADITSTIAGASGSVTVTVLAPVAVGSVAVSPLSSNVAVGAYTQLSATPKDASGTPVTGFPITWSSSNPAVAQVFPNGLVQGIAGGTVTISATAGGKTGSATITVAAPVTAPPPVATSPSGIASVVVLPGSAALTVGLVKQFIALPRDAKGNTMGGKTVTWTSSNPAVATVTAAGLVTAKAAGSVTITATAEGIKGTAQVNVALPY